MTDVEMLQALIHIKRHIVSRPIKEFIQTKIEALKKPVESNQEFLAGSYPVSYQMPLYGQKKVVKIDVIV